MTREHSYTLSLLWTGNAGSGTSGYGAYRRDHEIRADGKPAIAGSSDDAFLGDAGRWSPEELLVASLSQCHMLWYLHLAAEAGVVVTAYRDTPSGTMVEDGARGGRFTGVLLRPAVTVADAGMRHQAERLHGDAGALCFVARSVNFPVRHEPTTGTGLGDAGG